MAITGWVWESKFVLAFYTQILHIHAISDCLNVDRVSKRVVVTSFFLDAAVAYSGDSLFFLDVTTANIFSSVNKNVVTSLDEYFSPTVSNGWDLRGSSVHSAREHGHFRAQTFFVGSLATHLRGGGIFYYRFTGKSACERTLKIDQHLAKLAAKNIVAPFFRTRWMHGRS